MQETRITLTIDQLKELLHDKCLVFYNEGGCVVIELGLNGYKTDELVEDLSVH